LRIVFFGSSPFSCLVLGALLDGPHEIVAAVTQPDQPKGRRMQMCPTVLCQEASALDLPVLKPASLRRNTEFIAELAALKPDALLVASYGQIIPSEILELTPWPLNVHPSLLPLLRGASPIRSTLLQGHGVTGCCIMRMTPRLDDGDVLLMQDLEIDPDWNHERLQNQLGMLGGELALQALDLCETGQAQFQPQDHAFATYTKTYSRADTEIDWTRPTGDLYNFVRAWDPDVGALTCLPDGRKLKVWRASLDLPEELALDLMMAPTIPGSVVRVDKQALWIATADGALQLVDVQPESKARMPIASFLAGNSLELGEFLG
jgi:methionyl-tRNA formyltransferase